ncbi:DNA repair protein RAD51 homolog 4 isoform X2 [Ricinus communis]|uniref:DNA repair and recombination protein radB, putative n=1 Tax=Ricinus communis TaxID=3988 RepID=B9SYN5_RICCO|nr:DNA repair protein RAD51 homolog 4 isoform X2 [Ricinus communis]EEF31269.1 DNA repair and recombination protein radB, putative [Ricinus communis]|eukprot:XP_002531104.1 DNA repair protein RAD51 homolog 4 isoform X2 [Ricinus communis]
MAPLKSLEKSYSILDSNFQSFCASHAIFTVEDFLIQDLDALATLAEQEPTSQRLKEGINQILSIIDKQQHQPWLNGFQLLKDALQNKHVLSTGFDGIDSLLGGGVREGQLTELVGSSSSGKTQVCLQVAANVAKQHMGRVIFVDTGNSFSPRRIEQFVGRISGSALNQTVMSNILCHSVFDIFSMFDVLHQLEISLRSQGHSGDFKVQSLIVDSISSLITPILGGGGSQGHALMTSAGILLKKLAHEHNIAVLVTNHMVAGEGGNFKPALGESWKSIPHVRLLLSRDQGKNVCNVTILKHPSQASGKAARFTVDD